MQENLKRRKIADLYYDLANEEERASNSLFKTLCSIAQDNGWGKDKGKMKVVKQKFSLHPNKINFTTIFEECVAWFLVIALIPMNALNSLFAQKAIDTIIKLEGTYQKITKKEYKLLIESYRCIWKETRCTLMVDGY